MGIGTRAKQKNSKTGKSLIALKEGLDLSTAAGRLMANMMAVFANFERDRIRERTMLGLARAKAQGKRIGRHPLDCNCGKCKIKKPSPANPNDFIEGKGGKD